MNGQNDLQTLWKRWQDGDSQAIQQVLNLVFPELRRLAVYQLENTDHDDVYNATTLVHETIMHMSSRPNLKWHNHGHFLALSARTMRQLLQGESKSVGARRHGQKISMPSATNSQSAPAGKPKGPIAAILLRMFTLRS